MAARLASANFLLVALTVVTGPLQAQALGPSGRGELAAITVPGAMTATIASLGLGSYATFARARGKDLGVLLGTIGALLGSLGLFVALLGVPLASTLANGRHTVFVFLVIAFALAPLSLFGLLALDVLIGEQEWKPVLRMRVTAALIATVPIPLLYVLDALTVRSAAIVSLSTLIAYGLPVAVLMRRRPQLKFDSGVALEGFGYGLKSWVGGLTNVTNARLDQLLMIRLVSSAELGRYAVAVNLSGFFVNPLVGALITGTTARIASGETAIVARSSRIVLVGMAVIAAGVAAVSPWVLPHLFGAGFEEALPVTWILLVGTVPVGLNAVFSSAVSSAGEPGIAARAEALGAAITVPGLLICLRTFGIVGAAAVSVAAYTATCGYLLRRTRGRFGGSYADYLVPRWLEIRELGGRAVGILPAGIRRNSG